jgi:hypothetical protein
MTRNFNTEIGKGGFGSVYYGKLPDGQEVAVKIADGSSRQGKREFLNEVCSLNHMYENYDSLVNALVHASIHMDEWTHCCEPNLYE